MRFHQNFILSLLFFVLLFALFELKNVLLFQAADWWVVNETAMGGVYNSDLYFDTILFGTDSWPLWLVILSKFVLLLSASMVITRAAIKNLIFDERSYFPMILFPILFAGIYTSVGSLKMLVIVVLQIWLFTLLFRGFKRSSSIAEYFYAGIITSMSTLIYTQSALSFITVLLSVALLNRGVRELFCAVVGFLLPVFLYSYLHWMLGGQFMDIPNELWRSFITPSIPGVANWIDTTNRLGLTVLIVSLLPLALATCVSIASLRGTLRYARRRQRKFLNMLVFQFLLVTVVAFLLPSSAPQTILMNSVPLSVILSYYFCQYQNSRFAKWIFWLMPIGMLLYNIALICA